MVTGAPGTLVMAYTVRTDIPAFAHTSYYSDDLTPLVTQCTGDAREYGAGGFRVDHDLPNTDPAAELTTPLTTVAEPYGPTVAVGLLPPAPWVRLGLSPNPARSARWRRDSAASASADRPFDPPAGRP